MNLIKLMAASAVMVAAGNLASAQNPVAAPVTYLREGLTFFIPLHRLAVPHLTGT